MIENDEYRNLSVHRFELTTFVFLQRTINESIFIQTASVGHPQSQAKSKAEPARLFFGQPARSGLHCSEASRDPRPSFDTLFLLRRRPFQVLKGFPVDSTRSLILLRLSTLNPGFHESEPILGSRAVLSEHPPRTSRLGLQS